ncbi:MAG: hypothetical protein GX904_00460 [Acholeplasmataceae bacterium]|nr:hypothetical protein [Acholeplasmataceae bacterium]
MIKKILLWLITALSVSLFACSGGQTTTTITIPATVDTSTFYEIGSVEDLIGIEMNKSYLLVQDLDLSGLEWVPLGSIEKPFRGIFDGNGHSITNLTITKRNDSFNGLFAHVKGIVKDLVLTNFSIDYTAQFITYAGGLAGYLSGDVSNVRAEGSIKITNNVSNTYAGLLAGISVATVTQTMKVKDFVANKINDVEVSGELQVSGKDFIYVGGLAGKISNTVVENVKADIEITAATEDYRIYAGGLAGHHYGGILVGYDKIIGDPKLPIKNIYVSGTIAIDISGIQASVGGLAGFSQYGVYENIVTDIAFSFAGTKIISGLFLGEAWNGEYHNFLAAGSMVLVAEPGQEAVLDSLFGFVNAEPDLNNAFYHTTSAPITANALGTNVSACDSCLTAAWFATWLEWDEAFISFTALASSFTE